MTDTNGPVPPTKPARVISGVDRALLEHLAAYYAPLSPSTDWAQSWESDRASGGVNEAMLTAFGSWLETELEQGRASFVAPANAKGPLADICPPELKILADPTFANRPTDLHLVVTSAWERSSFNILHRALQHLIPGGPDVTLSQIDSPEHTAAVLGDLPHLFAADPEPVAVNGIAGSEQTRRALNSVADLWGVRVLVEEGGQLYARLPLVELTSSVVLGALHLTKTKTKTSQETDIQILQRGYEGLVTADDKGGYRPTRTLHHLAADRELVGLPDHHSACADLLEEHGSITAARELRRLIRHWLRERIWSINYVPEMVLHDEAHSVAVDRNVASLCEPLIERGTFDVHDLFILALAAWLHDWGHASAKVDGEFPTDPVEVRNYHGPLTARKLEQETSRHGIASLTLDPETGRHDLRQHAPMPDTKRSPRDLRNERVVNEVALLCAHHQGWTSCSHLDPTASNPDLNLFATAPSTSSPTSMITDPAEQLKVKSFAQNFEDRCAASSVKPDMELNRAYGRLAILRVADAADIGVHRVPDFATHGDRHEALAKTSLDWVSLVLDTRKTVTIANTGDEKNLQLDLDSAAFQAVRTAHAKLLGQIMTQPSWEQKEVDDIVAHADVAPWLKSGKGRNDLSKVGRQFVSFAWDYSTHVIKQVAFYQGHRQIRAVIPTLRENESGMLRLVLHVVSFSGDGEKADPDKITKRVRADVIREFAVVELDGQLVATNSKDTHKAPMRDHLRYQLDIDTRGLEVEIFEPDHDPVEMDEMTSALAPRKALPFAGKAGTRWLTIGSRGELESLPFNAREVPGAHRPLAATIDGRFVGSCVEGAVIIHDVLAGTAIEPIKLTAQWVGSTLVGLREVSGGFQGVLTKGRLAASLDLSYPDDPDQVWASKQGAPLTVGVIDFEGRTIRVDSTGVLSGRRASEVTGDAVSLAGVDLVAHGSHFLLAAVEHGGTVIAIRRFTVNDRSRLLETSAKVDLDIGHAVVDVMWVRGRQESQGARLVVVSATGVSQHDVQIEGPR